MKTLHEYEVKILAVDQEAGTVTLRGISHTPTTFKTSPFLTQKAAGLVEEDVTIWCVTDMALGESSGRILNFRRAGETLPRIPTVEETLNRFAGVLRILAKLG